MEDFEQSFESLKKANAKYVGRQVLYLTWLACKKSKRLISSKGHRCFTISPLQLPAAATRFPSHDSG